MQLIRDTYVLKKQTRNINMTLQVENQILCFKDNLIMIMEKLKTTCLDKIPNS